MYRILFSQLL